MRFAAVLVRSEPKIANVIDTSIDPAGSGAIRPGLEEVAAIIYPQRKRQPIQPETSVVLGQYRPSQRLLKLPNSLADQGPLQLREASRGERGAKFFWNFQERDLAMRCLAMDADDLEDTTRLP